MAGHRTSGASLKDVLPKAGFTWGDGPRILSTNRRDQIVANRLRDAVERFNRSSVEPHLAQIFTRGAVIASAYSSIADGPAFRLRLRNFAPFASGAMGRRMSDKVWNDLVKAVLAARAAWYESPRPPVNVAQHGVLAHAVDKFNAAIQGKWEEVVLDDGLTLEDLAGEDIGDSDAEGEEDEEQDEIGDEALWALIEEDEIEPEDRAMAADMDAMDLDDD